MKKKNIKDIKATPGKKVPHVPQQYIPQPHLQNLHSTSPIQCPPNQLNENEPYIPFAEPFSIPDEWSGPPDIEAFNKALMEQTEPYEDPDHSKLESHLPLTFIKREHNDIMWLRPSDYVVNANIDKEIKKLYPKKRYVQMREDIKVVYQEELKECEENAEENEDEHHDLDDYIKEDSVTLKRNIYKDFYKFLEKPPELYVIHYTERDETDEEYHKRVDAIIENQKNELTKFKMFKPTKLNPKEKRPTPPIVQRPEDFPKLHILEQNPSNIDVRDLVTKKTTTTAIAGAPGTFGGAAKQIASNYHNNSFLTWLSSIYQFILDLEIKDCVKNVNVFANIYPQRNGVPIYNPNGHYVVKLYFMGKPRKIEIDDRMPCSKDGEFIFPKCDNLNELWPHLFTKALLKLNLYKVKHPFYTKFEENVDTSYIYAITGYHAQILENLKSEEAIIESLNINLSDDAVINKKKYILCLNLEKQSYKENEEIYYDEILERIEKQKKGETIGLVLNDEHTVNASAPNVDVQKNLKRRQSVAKSGSTLYKHLSSLTEGYFRGDSSGGGGGGTASLGTFVRSLRREKTSVAHHYSVLDSKLKVISNYAYSINDFFSNDSFNMNRLKPLDFSDLKQTLKDTTVVFKQLNKEEKKAYIKQRKELKEKQQGIKNSRIDDLRNEGNKFLIIKIKNDSVGQYKLNSILSYSEEQISMAKKCLLNNWKYPPPSFFDKYFKKYEEDSEDEQQQQQQQQMQSEQNQNNENNKEQNNDINTSLQQQQQQPLINVNANVSNEIGVISEYAELNRRESIKAVVTQKKPVKGERKKKKIGTFDWTRQAYIQLIGPENLDIYNDTETNPIKQPIQKQRGGNWMNFGDFKSLFNTFLVLHNPISIFKGGSLSIDNNWHSYQLDIYEPLEDFTVFKLNSNDIENKENENYSAFLIFEPNNDSTLICRDKIYSYIILDVYDSEHTLIEGDICLNRFYSTYHFMELKGNKDYYIIIRGGIYQFGFYLQLFSEAHQLENLSYINYMTSVYEYQFMQFKIDHPMIERNSYYLLGRFVLDVAPPSEPTEEGVPAINEEDIGDVKIAVHIRYPLKYVKPFIDVLIYNDEDSIKINSGKKVFIGEEITLNKGKYFIIIAINKCNYALKDNSIDIDIIYSNKNYKVEQMENIDYYKITNDYNVNRHNILFKELIYSGEKVYTALDIELKQIQIEQPTTNVATTSANVKALTTEYTKKDESINEGSVSELSECIKEDENNNKKVKLIFKLYQLVDPSNTEVPLIDTKFSYGLRGNLLQTYEGFNCLTIPHICFEGGLLVNDDPKKKFGSKQSSNIPVIETPPNPIYPYLFVCYIDHDVNMTKLLSNYKLSWSIRVFPSDTISFVKDTSKEEHEKKLKNSWEENEPGRAAKAALSRKRFLLEERKNTGGKLTEEETKFLLTTRERKLVSLTLNENDNNHITNVRASAKKNAGNNKLNASSKKPNPFTSNTVNGDDTLNNQSKDPSVLKLNKTLPKTTDHCSYYIRNYLNYAYKNRTIQIDTVGDQYQKVINTEQLKTEKSDRIIDEVDEFEKVTKTEMSNTFYKMHSNNTDMLNTFYKTHSGFRVNKQSLIKDIFNQRNNLREQFQSKITCQNTLQDIIMNYNINSYPMDYMITSYKEGAGLLGKDDALVVKLFGVISAKKEESIKNDLKKFSAKDKNNVIKILEDIEFNQWDISQETKTKLKELVK